MGETRPTHTRYQFQRLVVLKSWYLWLQRAIKFVPRRLTKAVLTFFIYKLICLILPWLLIAFCRSNIMRLTTLWSLPYLILKSPWEAVKVSELCCLCVGAALAKPRAVLYGTRWDVVAGMMEDLGFPLQPWSQSEFGKQQSCWGCQPGVHYWKEKTNTPSFPPLDSGEGSKFHTEIIVLLEKLLWQLPAPEGEFLWGKSHVRRTNSFPFLPLMWCAGTVLSWSTWNFLTSLPWISLPAFLTKA